MAVNLLASLTPYDAAALADARRNADALGYRLVRARHDTGRLAAWIDWRFAPGWWSSECAAGEVWFAERDGAIAGFAAFDARGLRFPWLRPYRERTDVGIFGPYGVDAAHRGSGIGAALLTAALCGLREAAYTGALIPAVAGDALIAMYERRCGARIADEFNYDAARAYRTVILASGNGTNAQNVFDRVAEGRLALDVRGLVANADDAPVLDRARRAGVDAHAIAWNRAAESRSAYDARVIDAVAAFEPELVLLLGWMHLLPAAFLDRFPEVLNVHPAFLPFDARADDVVMPDGSTIPAFRGARSPEATIAAGVPWSGATVHRVTVETDRGDVFVRTPLALAAGTTLDELRAALRPIEHAAVASAIRRWVFER